MVVVMGLRPMGKPLLLKSKPNDMSQLTKNKLIDFYKEYKKKWNKNAEAMANYYTMSLGDCVYLIALGKDVWKSSK